MSYIVNYIQYTIYFHIVSLNLPHTGSVIFQKAFAEARFLDTVTIRDSKASTPLDCLMMPSKQSNSSKDMQS